MFTVDESLTVNSVNGPLTKIIIHDEGRKKLAAANLGSLRMNHPGLITESEKCKPTCHYMFFLSG
jgi:hypothetical protein